MKTLFNRTAVENTRSVKATGNGAVAVGGSMTGNVVVSGNGNKVAGAGSKNNSFTGNSSYSSSGSSTVQIKNGDIVITCSNVNSIIINGKKFQ